MKNYSMTLLGPFEYQPPHLQSQKLIVPSNFGHSDQQLIGLHNH